VYVCMHACVCVCVCVYGMFWIEVEDSILLFDIIFVCACVRVGV
jgi:hypothetical protein